MTFIYSLGIFTVMLPVVLGARVLTQIFLGLTRPDLYHWWFISNFCRLPRTFGH